MITAIYNSCLCEIRSVLRFNLPVDNHVWPTHTKWCIVISLRTWLPKCVKTRVCEKTKVSFAKFAEKYKNVKTLGLFAKLMKKYEKWNILGYICKIIKNVKARGFICESHEKHENVQARGFICKSHKKCENVKAWGFICKSYEKCESSRFYLQNHWKNVKSENLEGLLA